jgi:hypothetical protein
VKSSEIRQTLLSSSTSDKKKVNKPSALSPRYHAVRFYDNPKSLSQIVAAFLGDGFAAGQPGIVVGTPVRRAAILRELVAVGIDVVAAQRSGDLVFVKALARHRHFERETDPPLV